MSFGKNPHVVKAEAAEQKALCARDDMAREQAWREAAHRWERAAEREKDDKRRNFYTQNAEAARRSADAPPMEAQASEPAPVSATTVAATAEPADASSPKPRFVVLN